MAESKEIMEENNAIAEERAEIIRDLSERLGEMEVEEIISAARELGINTRGKLEVISDRIIEYYVPGYKDPREQVSQNETIARRRSVPNEFRPITVSLPQQRHSSSLLENISRIEQIDMDFTPIAPTEFLQTGQTVVRFADPLSTTAETVIREQRNSTFWQMIAAQVIRNSRIDDQVRISIPTSPMETTVSQMLRNQKENPIIAENARGIDRIAENAKQNEIITDDVDKNRSKLEHNERSDSDDLVGILTKNKFEVRMEIAHKNLSNLRLAAKMERIAEKRNKLIETRIKMIAAEEERVRKLEAIVQKGFTTRLAAHERAALGLVRAHDTEREFKERRIKQQEESEKTERVVGDLKRDNELAKNVRKELELERLLLTRISNSQSSRSVFPHRTANNITENYIVSGETYNIENPSYIHAHPVDAPRFAFYSETQNNQNDNATDSILHVNYRHIPYSSSTLHNNTRKKGVTFAESDTSNPFESLNVHQGSKLMATVAVERACKYITCMKIKFEGSDDEEAEEFIESFREVIILNGLTEQETLAVVKVALEGKAKIWYRAVKLRINKYEDFLREFRGRFVGINRQSQLEEEIKNRKQKPGESIADFLTYVQLLYSKLNPQPPIERQIQQACKNLHPLYVMHFKPHQMNDFLEFLIEGQKVEEQLKCIDSYDSVMTHSKTLNTNKFKRTGNFAVCESPKDTFNHRMQYAPLRNKYNPNHIRRSNRSSSCNNLLNKVTMTTQTVPENVSPETSVCYNCNQPGHFARECRVRKEREKSEKRGYRESQERKSLEQKERPPTPLQQTPPEGSRIAYIDSGCDIVQGLSLAIMDTLPISSIPVPPSCPSRRIPGPCRPDCQIPGPPSRHVSYIPSNEEASPADNFPIQPYRVLAQGQYCYLCGERGVTIFTCPQCAEFAQQRRQ